MKLTKESLDQLYLIRCMDQLDENTRSYLSGVEMGGLIGRIHLAEDLLKLPLTPTLELHAMPIKLLEEMLAQLMLKLAPPTNGTP